MPDNQLTWSLVIATYKRAHILPQCLRLAAQQTRKPMEVIVVDASPDWEDTRALVSKEFAADFADIDLQYVKAIVASSTTQRNQGVDMASGDVVFLIDDDSLMYPDCAEEVMKVYEADHGEEILGVSAMLSLTPPDVGASDEPPPKVTEGVHPEQTPLRRFIKRILNTQGTQFLPYDGTFPEHTLPEHLASLDIGIIQFMTGSSMTFRRKVFETIRFNELFKRYAAGEDQDLSYRVSQRGILVNAVKAHLCHLEISGGRITKYQVAVLAALNPAVFQQFNATDLKLVNSMWRKILWRRAFINFLKDLSSRELSFMSTRGVLYALTKLSTIYKLSGEELGTWYQNFQSELLSR